MFFFVVFVLVFEFNLAQNPSGITWVDTNSQIIFDFVVGDVNDVTQNENMGFTEGPVFVQDNSYSNGGYVLYTEMINGKINRLHLNEDNQFVGENFMDFSENYENITPCGLAYNKDCDSHKLIIANWNPKRPSIIVFNIQTKEIVKEYKFLKFIQI